MRRLSGTGRGSTMRIVPWAREPPEIQQIFGELFLRAYTAVKCDEFEQFNRVVSSWEREHLLLQV